MSHLVLIVEDSPQMASNLEIALQQMPEVEVAIACTGVEALRMLEGAAVPVAAIVTDLEMPRMDGYELIERLRSDSRFARLPIIVASGSSDPETPERVRRLGADAYFSKPYSPVELKHRLEQLLHANQNNH